MKQKKGYSQFMMGLIVALDFIILNATFLLVYLLFQNYIYEEVNKNIRPLILILNLCYIPCVAAIGSVLHKRIVFAERITARVFYSVLLHAMIFFTCLQVMKQDDISRLFLLTFYITFFVSLLAGRLGVRFALKMYRSKGFNYTNVIIVGGGKNGVSVAEEMMSDPGYGYKILGFFDDNPAGLPSNLNFLGTTSEVEAYLSSENNQVDEVYCTLPESAEAIIYRLLNFCENNMIRFNIVPEVRRYVKKRMQMELLGEIPVLVLRDEPLQSYTNRLLKRAFDVIFSVCFLMVCFIPVYILVGFCIKITSRGPIFFKQKRTGRSGIEFNCYKFRTMIINEEANEKQAVRDDPRVTQIGSFLRRSNIDEIPQFFNVLRGDMSIVGPRPHMLQHTIEYSQLIDKYMVRHLVKPGLTGWAQVTGYRGETKTLEQMEGRVKRDVWYIENWTLWLDLKIIYRTIRNMFSGEPNAC